MARIYPERLPEYVQRDPLRSAERKVYHALADLPSAYTVFYGVAWLDRASDGARDGEADFVIVHPDGGVLVLEVKGGGIGFDASTAQWVSVDRYGHGHIIKNPVQQATESKYALLSKLKNLPGWGDRWITIGHGVVFPDIQASDLPIRPDLPREIVLDRKHLEDPAHAIQALFTYWARPNHHPLRQDGVRLLTDLLARSFTIHTPLGVELNDEDERIIELTEAQMRVLDLLAFQRRAAIQGCAGSGKTMLALEKAKRLANEGFDVLLTCFNVALAQYLAQRTPDDVEVFHFHGLCEAMIEEAGIRAAPPQDRQEYYDMFLPGLLLDAIDELGPQYDAIIVDEGQDFKEDWWIGLQSLLRDQEQGVFYVFFDDNQNLYRGVDHIPGLIDSPPFSLTENCRNTKAIHHLVARFHPNGSAIRCIGPEGRPPVWVPYESHRELETLVRQTLHRLINEEDVAPGDLIILTPKAEHRSIFKEGKRLGNFTLTRKPPTEGDRIIWVTTVHAFKGLERKVALLTELDPWAGRNLATLLYVGCSRARTHLIIFHNHRFDPARKFDGH
ncbi:MAG: ATP-binding domain-containing protein [Chloroflexi bacterium]|nr:ATP-binding domain-containing protein [Chloroflexota bacterium]